MRLFAPTYQKYVEMIPAPFFQISLFLVDNLGRDESLDEYQNEDKNGRDYGNKWHPNWNRLTLEKMG